MSDLKNYIKQRKKVDSKFAKNYDIDYQDLKTKITDKQQEHIMQLAVNVSVPNVLNLISQMSLNEIEEVKNKLIEKELYFKRFKKDKIENIMKDFQNENYSDEFLNDLENGLKKSSVYNAN